MEMEEKKNELTEAALPVQELPADIPDEVRQKLCLLYTSAGRGPCHGRIFGLDGKRSA